MSAYSDWAAQVQQAGGVATTWPFFDDGHAGEPAARFSNQGYANAYNAGQLPATGTRAAGSGMYVYVLGQAMGGPDVLASSPHTMTVAERAANATFTGLDEAATTVGLPSLTGIEGFLKGIGRDVLVGVAVTVAVAFVLRRKR